MSSRTRNFKSKPNTSKLEYRYKDISVIYFIPLLLIVGLVPLITYGKYIKLPQIQQLYWVGGSEYLDFFSYWKSKWVVFLTGVATVEYIYLYWTKKLPFKREWKYYIPLLIYVLCVILSTIFAVDVDTALNGFVDMYQGMWVLISYALITFLTINFVNSERDLKLFCYAFVFLIIVEGALGLGQYIGYDFFQTKLGNKLILPSDIIVEDLTFNFGKHTIYGTLFNTNYVGSFAALVLPLSIAFLMSSKTILHRIFSGLAVFFSLVLWIGCNSRAGYVGVAVGAVFALFLFRREIVKHYRICISLLIIIVILFIVLFDTFTGTQINRFSYTNNLKMLENAYDNCVLIKNIVIEDNKVTILSNDDTFSIEFDKNNNFNFLDCNNNKLSFIYDDREIAIDDSRYNRFRFEPLKSLSGIVMKIYYDGTWPSIIFYCDNTGIKVIGSGGRLTIPSKCDKIQLFKYDKFASNRVYIWGRSLPLLKPLVLIGAGPDTYPIVFPQDDFVGKLNIGWNANMVVDKPHDMYLQISINTGVISLFVLLIVWICYIINSLRIYSKNYMKSFKIIVGIMCFVGVLGYLFSGIFNDNIVSVFPLFCVILGLGISINKMILSEVRDETGI